MINRKIISPMPWGNGAYIVHRLLSDHISGYKVFPYNPYLSIFPFFLPLLPTGITSADLIHTSPDYAIFFKKRRIPTVITFHNFVLDRYMAAYSSILQRIHYLTDLRLFTRLALTRACCCTAVSQFTAEMVKKHLDVHKPVHVIYNGVDEKKFTPLCSKRKHGKQINVIFSGNLTLRKGIQWLPEIAGKLGGGIKVWYTSGLRKNLKTLKPDKLAPLGNVSFSKMPDLYKEMDILLMPTVREGFGLSVAEAMSCGLPVVASNCSSIPELVDHERGGFLCPVGDVDVFSEKINILADSPSMRREMGEYNRQKVEKMFTLNRMIKEYRVLFEKVLEKEY